MPGRTGKRAKPAGDCTICRRPIAGDFMRIGKGDDRHTECQYPEGPNGRNAGFTPGRPTLARCQFCGQVVPLSAVQCVFVTHSPEGMSDPCDGWGKRPSDHPGVDEVVEVLGRPYTLRTVKL